MPLWDDIIFSKMKNSILVHGTCSKEEYFSNEYPSLSNSHWFPWLQKQLLIKNNFCQTPEMPEAHIPNYEKWKKEFERFDINKDTDLVGHSCGGGFLVRWLSENRISIGKLVLVAPWLDPDRRKTTDFFEFKIDPDIVKRTEVIHLLISSDDNKDILNSVATITREINSVSVHKFDNMGHFTFEEMKTDKFPFLRDLILDPAK